MQLRMLADAEAWRLEIIGRIPLRKRGGGVSDWVTVDGEDLQRLSGRRWYLNTKGYALRTEGGRRSKHHVRMHREIMGLASGDERSVDHINRNQLDNRRSNLRVVTSAQNRQNLGAHKRSTSAYRGVSFETFTGKWRAQVGLNYRNHPLGRYDTEEEAAKAASDFRAKHMPFSADAQQPSA